MRYKTILSLFDYSGNWSEPYRKAGYNVQTVDLQHAGQDVRLLSLDDIDNQPIHGILAAPPCTVFASSGARWVRKKHEMLEGLSCLDAVLRLVVALEPEWYCIENPIGTISRYLGKPLMTFNPCDYGGLSPDPSQDAYTKRTSLYGKFNPSLQASPIEPILGSKTHKTSRGTVLETKRMRSKTPKGFAQAFFLANP